MRSDEIQRAIAAHQASIKQRIADLRAKERAEKAKGVVPSGYTQVGEVYLKPATSTTPTMAKYKKKDYILTNDGRWLDVNDKQVSRALTHVLNSALEQT